MTTYFGKYRGKVENNIDPKMMGRIQVSCPSVLGDGRLAWAMPCVPYAGPGVGMLLLPPNGANVWVEFEEGNSDRPIWAGCFWGVGEAASFPPTPEFKTLKTEAFTLTIMEPPKAPNAAIITLQSASGMKVVMNPAQMEVTNGAGASITLMGPKVTINNGALEVT